MVELNPTISIITLHLNDLNTKLKGRDHWIRFFLKKVKTQVYVSHLQETHFKYKDTYVKRLEKIDYANTIQKKAGVTMLDQKLDFRAD